MSNPISRRQFWRFPLKEAAKTIAKGEPEKIKRPVYIRPPGAIADEDLFLETCLRCGACVTACPHEAVFEVGPGGGPAAGTPTLVPQKSPCHWCVDWDCINVCSSGALSLPDDGSPEPIAKAFIRMDLCLVTQGTLCDECIMHCPPDIKAITRDGLFPKMKADLCTGCGLCAHHCAAEPQAISMKPVER